MPLRNAKVPEKKVQLLEDLLQAGTWTFDLRSKEVTWSLGLYKLLGLDPRTVTADYELYQSLVHPDDRLANGELLALASTDRLSSRRTRIIRPDGHLIWIESSFEPQYDREGNLGVLHGVVQDVSLQQKLTMDCSHLSTLNTSLRKLLGGDFWRTDASGKLLDLGSWIRFTGQTQAQLHDYEALEALHPDDRDHFRTAWAAGISAKHRFETRVRVRRHDGVYVMFASAIIPIMDQFGEVIEWHGASYAAGEKSAIGDRATSVASRHIRAARALLDWTAPDLAERSGVSFSTIRRMEVDVETVKPEKVRAARECLEKHGILFVRAPDENVFVSCKPAAITSPR